MMPEDTPELRALYQAFEEQQLMPLWTQLGNLMPRHPMPRAVPHVWRWADLLPLAQKAGELVPVGRGGERRALGLANPGLGETPISARRSGRRSSISGRARQRPNTAMRRTPSALSSKAKASGRSSTAIQCA